MDINFPYGDHKLTLTINEKNLLTVVNREEKEELKNPAEAVLKTLREPIASPPLKDLVKKGDEVVIIVDDNTRPCPDPTILPPLLDELKGSSINKNDIKIIVAYGLHPPLNKNGLIDLLGKGIIEKYQVINHDPEQVVQLGKTSRGVPIEVNEHVVQADFLISTGFIEPHYFAGFSGGRKSIMPGVSGRNAIYKNHYFKLKGDPHTIAGRLDKNPIHQDAVEHAKAAHLDFIINVLLNQRKEIIKVVSGDPIKAHLKGVRLERELVCKQVDQKADIAITTNSGAPLDLNLYQSVKGISTASLVTKKGGIILLASECADGIGPDIFERWHKEASTPEEVLKRIKEKQHPGCEPENRILADIQKDYQILLKSSLEKENVEKMIIKPVDTLKEGLEKAFHKLGNDVRIIAIPEGPLVLPTIA